MPKLGLTMTEGTIAEWRVQPGERVEKGQVIFIVETEKISTEIEAQNEGLILELIVEVGSTVAVGEPVARLDRLLGTLAANDEPLGIQRIVTLPNKADERPRTLVAQDAARRISTPLARRIAAQNGIELSMVTGSGPRGRIKRVDVEKLIKTGTQTPLSDSRSDIYAATNIEEIIARRVCAAKSEIPHFYVTASADITELLRLRDQLNNTESGLQKLSVNHFIVAAAARAIAVDERSNRIWENGAFRHFQHVSIGVAVETPRGVMMPRIHGVERLNIDGVARESTRLIGLAREGRLSIADMSGGALSISNVGMFGAVSLTPIIDLEQSAILGVGAAIPGFHPDSEGRPKPVKVLNLTLACDHRVFDGAQAARLLMSISAFLEAPLCLLREP